MNELRPPPALDKPPQRRYGGAFPLERQRERRERLIKAAVDVFGREGYARATRRAICGSACIADRYFRENFADLDELYAIVHLRLVSELTKVIAVQLATQIKSPVEGARIGLTAFFEYIRADPRRARILLIDAASNRRTIPGTNSPIATWYVQWFRGRLAKQYPFTVESLEVDLIAIGLIGMTIHVASMWTQEEFQRPVDLVVGHCLYAWVGLYRWIDELEQRHAHKQPVLPIQDRTQHRSLQPQHF